MEAERATLTINLDYQTPPAAEGDIRKTNSELTENYILHAVNDTHPKGLEGQLRRVFARLQRKLDEAIDSGTDTIELEKAEQDLLRKSFNECKVTPALAKYFVVLEDEIERATKP
jgi:hypothetical protein